MIEPGDRQGRGHEPAGRLATLRHLVALGIDEADRGMVRPFDEALVDEILARGRDRPRKIDELRDVDGTNAAWPLPGFRASNPSESLAVPIDVLRDAGLSSLIEGDALEVVASAADGLVFTEGPLWLADGSLLFQDIKAFKTYKVDPLGAVSVLRSDTEAANGQTFDAEGRIVFCEQDGRRISRMNADGSGFEHVVEHWQGKHLNSPNDIVARSDGLVYFTDPAYGVPKPEDQEIPFQGVFALDSLAEPRLLVDDFEKPNGLAFSPDEKTLYVCDTGKYHVRAFDVDPSGALDVASGRVFCTLDPEGKGGPDGMKVDRGGRVFVAVAQGVWVFEPGGKLLGILAVSQRPSNLAWGGPDGRTLAITAVDHVYKVRFREPGVTPPFLDAATG